jgi:hypothetical protein
MSQKPNVLIFGEYFARGTPIFQALICIYDIGAFYGLAPALVQHLLPPSPSESRVAYIQLVDKYSLNPPTTFVGKDFLALIEEKKDAVHYKQANLINPGT